MYDPKADFYTLWYRWTSKNLKQICSLIVNGLKDQLNIFFLNQRIKENFVKFLHIILHVIDKLSYLEDIFEV